MPSYQLRHIGQALLAVIGSSNLASSDGVVHALCTECPHGKATTSRLLVIPRSSKQHAQRSVPGKRVIFYYQSALRSPPGLAADDVNFCTVPLMFSPKMLKKQYGMLPFFGALLDLFCYFRVHF